MLKWTTPTHDLVVEGVDMTGCDVYATYTQGLVSITKKVQPVVSDGDTRLTVAFTQRETGRFREGPVDIQVNWIYPNGQRGATKTAKVQATRNLLPKEVHYNE